MDLATYRQHGYSDAEVEQIREYRERLENEAIREGEAIRFNRLARSSVNKLNHNLEASFWPV